MTREFLYLPLISTRLCYQHVTLIESRFYRSKIAQKCFCGAAKCRGYLGKAPDENEEDEPKYSRLLSTETFAESEDSPEKMQKKKKISLFRDDTVREICQDFAFFAGRASFTLCTGTTLEHEILLPKTGSKCDADQMWSWSVTECYSRLCPLGVGLLTLMQGSQMQICSQANLRRF